MQGGEFEIILVGTALVIVIIALVASLFKYIFPKNKISKILENVTEWMWETFVERY